MSQKRKLKFKKKWTTLSNSSKILLLNNKHKCRRLLSINCFVAINFMANRVSYVNLSRHRYFTWNETGNGTQRIWIDDLKTFLNDDKHFVRKSDVFHFSFHSGRNKNVLRPKYLTERLWWCVFMKLIRSGKKVKIFIFVFLSVQNCSILNLKSNFYIIYKILTNTLSFQ